MAPVVVSNATVAKPADGSFKHYEEAKIWLLKQPACSPYLEGMGMGAIVRVLEIYLKTFFRWLV